MSSPIISNSIGKKVSKLNNRPFKSGLRINTIKAVINHPVLDIPAYTFEEDDSYVECRKCKTNIPQVSQT